MSVLLVTLLVVLPGCFSNLVEYGTGYGGSSSVPQYTMYEHELSSSNVPSGNPFYMNVTVYISTSSKGSRHPSMVFPCYYDDNNTWRFRFEPDVQGEWNWNISAPEIHDLNGMSGTVNCVAPSGSHGGLVSDPKGPYPQAMFHEDGTPYFLMGYECDWLWALDLEPDTSYVNLEAFIKKITSYGYNHILVNVYANYCGWSNNVPEPPRVVTKMTPWLNKTEGGFDYDHLNIQYFKHYDEMMRLLYKYGAVAHVMIMVWNKAVEWPAKESKQDDLYWTHVVSRYQGFPNIIFDVSKEANRIKTGYWANRFPFLVSLDAHKRLHTAHTECAFEEYCDFYALQQHSNSGTRAHDLYHDLVGNLEKYPNKPSANVEWEYEKGPIKTYPPSSSAGEMKVAMWSLYMAGGYAAWYYDDTAWDVITNATAPGYAICETAVKFWTQPAVKFWTYKRCNEKIVSHGGQPGFCLGKEGDTLLFYFPAGTSQFTISTTHSYSKGEWVDTTTGKTQGGVSAGSGKTTLHPPTSPDFHDAFLRLWN